LKASRASSRRHPSPCIGSRRTCTLWSELRKRWR
jgi:hypothetical protein